MADNFGLKIGVEGQKEFKKALADITSRSSYPARVASEIGQPGAKCRTTQR